MMLFIPLSINKCLESSLFLYSFNQAGPRYLKYRYRYRYFRYRNRNRNRPMESIPESIPPNI